MSDLEFSRRAHPCPKQWNSLHGRLPAGITDWADVRARHVQEWTVTLLDRYSDSYANNQFRALQQFFKWHATEDPDEPRPKPAANLKPPKVAEKLVPVFTGDELAAMLATCKGGGFQSRRDYAIISLFKDAGIRLSELAGPGLDDVNPASREATVTGKGDKQRTVRFTYDTSRALDRYTRERARHPMARVRALWLGIHGGPMTASGVYQMIERRGIPAGWLLPADEVQTLPAMKTCPRWPPSASKNRRSAAPYIGEVSTGRTSAAIAAQ
jgi:integrase/recombinase XerD